MYLGQEFKVFGDWFIIHFTENNGMAFGLELGGDTGKLLLTGFRIIAVMGILYYLVLQIKQGAKTGLIICISLVLAGAVGNIIDSVFYGVWFKDNYNEYLPDGTLKWKDHAPYLYGRVVDMLYFPLIEGRYPDWLPLLGGNSFMFFRPVFNIADTSISTGVFAIILFQKRFFAHTLSHTDKVAEVISPIENSEVESNPSPEKTLPTDKKTSE